MKAEIEAVAQMSRKPSKKTVSRQTTTIRSLERKVEEERAVAEKCQAEAEYWRQEAGKYKNKLVEAERSHKRQVEISKSFKEACHRLEGENNRLKGYIRRVREERGEIVNSLDPMPRREVASSWHADQESVREWWEIEEEY